MFLDPGSKSTPVNFLPDLEHYEANHQGPAPVLIIPRLAEPCHLAWPGRFGPNRAIQRSALHRVGL